MTRWALLLFVLTGCPRGGDETPEPTSDEPVAEPAPIEIDWPDAGVPP
jgi:hypothetical protein